MSISYSKLYMKWMDEHKSELCKNSNEDFCKIRYIGFIYMQDYVRRGIFLKENETISNFYTKYLMNSEAIIFSRFERYLLDNYKILFEKDCHKCLEEIIDKKI